MYTISIKTLTGKNIKYTSVSNIITCKNIKTFLEETEMIESSVQRLVLNGKKLEDDDTIDISNTITIYLILTLRGGMLHPTSGRTDFNTVKNQELVKNQEFVKNQDIKYCHICLKNKNASCCTIDKINYTSCCNASVCDDCMVELMHCSVCNENISDEEIPIESISMESISMESILKEDIIAESIPLEFFGVKDSFVKYIKLSIIN